MFKKLFKNLTDNITDVAKDMMADKMNMPSSDQTNQMPDFAQGDMQKIFDAGAASKGVKTPNTASEDPNDPLLQAVHGISIYDYAAGAAKIGEGCTDDEICAKLGVERPLWDEAKAVWNNRMRDDQTFNVVNVYSKYFGIAKDHEKLRDLTPSNAPQSTVPEGQAKETLSRLENDKHYFFEIQGALEAAYANGMDGAQWLVDELGLTVSQVNSAGVKYMSNIGIMAEMMDYQDKKKKEYGERFSKEHGTSGVADDIEF